MPTFERLSQSINRWVERLLFALGLSMTVIVAVQVFCRYVLNHSLFWSEELARFLLVWLTFLGASAAYRRKAHPTIDVIYGRLRPGWQHIFSILSHLVSLGLFAIMMVYGCQFAYFVRLQISPALYLPKWIVFSVIPVSGLILCLHGLNFLHREVTGWRRDH